MHICPQQKKCIEELHGLKHSIDKALLTVHVFSTFFTTILVVLSNMHFMPTQFKVSWTRIGDYIIHMYAKLL